MTDNSATAWLDGAPIGQFEFEPRGDEPTGVTWDSFCGVLHLSPSGEELREIVALGNNARDNFGFLGGVTDEGDRRGRRAMEALRELERAIELRTFDGPTLDARVLLWPIENTTHALRTLIMLNPAEERGAGVGAQTPVPPRWIAAESSRPDV